MFIHINESISLIHLTGSCTDKVDTSPWCITHQIYTIFLYCLFHF